MTAIVDTVGQPIGKKVSNRGRYWSEVVLCFSFPEIEVMGDLSAGAPASTLARAVLRDWEKARIYLHRELRNDLSL